MNHTVPQSMVIRELFDVPTPQTVVPERWWER